MRLFLMISLLGCTGSTESVDSGSRDTCDTAPPVNYANFGEGFLTENCQGCHASTAPNRYEAPESVVFDTVDDAWAWRDRILYRVLEDANPMPPAGGANADDMQRLEWWFECSEEGT